MAINLNKYTTKSQEAVAGAQELAQNSRNPEITPVHLLTALLMESDGIIGTLLEHLNVRLDQLRRIAEAELASLPKTSGGDVGLSRDGQTVLQTAQTEADNMHDEFVSTEHLLLALAKVPSKAKDLLVTLGLTAEKIDALVALLENKDPAGIGAAAWLQPSHRPKPRVEIRGVGTLRH